MTSHWSPAAAMLLALCAALLGSSSVARADLMLISATRSAGASGSVGDDDDFFADGSSDFNNDFGSWFFSNGVNIKQPWGSVDGFATQSSSIGSSGISMSATADANVSAGGGLFDYAVGGGNSSLNVTFQINSPVLLDINYSGGGYPAYVEPYFQLFEVGVTQVISYGSGTVQEQVFIGPGVYSLSAGISAGASTSFPGDSGSAQGGMGFSLNVLPVPEPSAACLVLVGAGLLPWTCRRWRR